MAGFPLPTPHTQKSPLSPSGFLILMQKVFNALSAVSFVLVLAIGTGGIFTYKWATSPETHEKIKNQVIESVKDSLKIPSMTGGPTTNSGKTGKIGIPSLGK